MAVYLVPNHLVVLILVPNHLVVLIWALNCMVVLIQAWNYLAVYTYLGLELSGGVYLYGSNPGPVPDQLCREAGRQSHAR